MERQNRKRDRIRVWTSLCATDSPHRARDLEPPVLEDEGAEVAVLVHAPHLDALDPPLIGGLRDGDHPEVHDPVREELLLERGVPGAEPWLLRRSEERRVGKECRSRW